MGLFPLWVALFFFLGVHLVPFLPLKFRFSKVTCINKVESEESPTDIASASDYFSFLVPVPVRPKSTTVQLFLRTSCKTGRILVPHSGWDLFPLLHIHSYNKMPITLANWNESVPCNQKKLIKTIRRYRFKNRQCDNNGCIKWCIKININ